MATVAQDDNPYVGPRTFKAAERAKFFGRTRETRDLTALIISSRLVLFYAPSGAGKSSLLNTMVGPTLEEEGFELLPVGRVSGYSGKDVSASNIYVYNLLSSINQSDVIPAGFETLTILDFLDNLVRHEDGSYSYAPDHVYPDDALFKPRALLIDQFEELVTTNAAFWPQRSGFFEQLAEAMKQDDQLWIVLTMREDFVARFDRYLHLIPNRLRHRFRMERLARAAALQAITMPVAHIRPFAEDAAELLVENLLRVRTAGTEEGVRLEQFVEPVQLQAVCYQMWEKLRGFPGQTITADDVERFADVDTALINFYEETIEKTVTETGVPEVDLRAWFDRELITEAGTSNMVFRGEETTGELPTSVADFVRQQFILGEVVRPGGTWYELVHDGFVAPIAVANGTWRQEQPLIQLAQTWDEAGRPDERLLTGRQLDQLEQTEWQVLGPLVAEYIDASRQAREAEEAALAAEKEAVRQRELEQKAALADEQHRRAEEAETAAARQRRSFVIALLLFVAALAAAITSVIFGQKAGDNADLAATRLVDAVAESTRAAENLLLAQNNELEAVAARRAAEAQATLAAENKELADIQANLAIAEATRAALSLATATVAQGQAIEQAAQAKAEANELSDERATVMAIASGALATQEAFLLLSTPVDDGSGDTPSVQEQLADVQAQHDLISSIALGSLQTGMNINLDAPNSNPFQDDTLKGLDWVRFVFKLDAAVDVSQRGNLDAILANLDPVVEAYALNGVSILFVLNQETVWGSAPWTGSGDFDAYAEEFSQRVDEIVEQMAIRYADYGALIAYEIWNEPDLAFNPSSIYLEPEQYAVLLDLASATIRDAAPEAQIILGTLGSGPNDAVSYLQRVETALGGTLPVDAIGVAPYGSWGNFAPFDWGQIFNPLSHYFSVFSAAFPEIPLWVTEIGVAADDEIGPEFYEEIAAYMRDVYQYIGTNFVRKVPVVIWFAWSDWMRNAGIVDRDGHPKEHIYEAFLDVRDSGDLADESARTPSNLPPDPISQHDPRWANLRIGYSDSTKTIGEWGSLLTCFAMTVNAFGYDVTPAQLNDIMLLRGGFIEPNLTKWNALNNVYSDIIYQGKFDPSADLLDRIDASLEEGDPVTIQVDLTPDTPYTDEDQHWVLIVGRDGDDYRIIDPWPFPTEEASLRAEYGGDGQSIEDIILSAIFYAATG